MSKMLFEGSSDSEAEIANLKTNQDYAKSYNKFREKELLKKLKDQDRNKQSSGSSDEDSESSEDENVADKKFDEEFFKALSSLKAKNPNIYDKNTKFFQDIADGKNDETNRKNKKQKPVTIRDFERKVILEKGGKYEDDEDSDDENVESQRPESPSYAAEQRILRSEIKKALSSDDSDDEDFGGIFKRREKTKEEKIKEEEEYAAWLAGKRNEIDENAAKALKPLKQYWSDPKLPKQEQFLRNYILNNGYQNDGIDEIPTYDEIIAEVSEDEEELEKQAEFEHKFNFRYEDPDNEFIKRFPRTIEASVRRKDERRKQKRMEVKERKVKEKEEKFRELEMLKEIKRKEIQEKISKLKEVTGNEELGFKEEELDEDFDPDAHDKRMQELFNEEYYGVDEGEEKPECPDIDDLKVEDWDNYDPEREDGGIDDDYEPHCEDDDFNMDCDYDPQAAQQALQNELIESTKPRRKRKRRNELMELIKKEKPPFNPEDEKTYEEYIEEYYNMDCEDMIGDIPCRFKYVETVPNDFGLTIEEILLAKNKELNQWVSLKKAVQIRPKTAELRDRNLYKMRAKNEALKRKIFRSIYGPASDEEDNEKEDENKQENKNTVKDKADETQKLNVGTSLKKKKKKKPKPNPIAGGTQNELTTDIQAIELKADVEPSISSALNNDKGYVDEAEKIAKDTNTPQTETSKKKKKKKNQANQSRNKQTAGNKQQKTATEFAAKQNERENPFNKQPSMNENKFRMNHPQSFRGKSQSTENNMYSQMSDERLKAYGLNPNKFRKQFGKQNRYHSNSSNKNNKFRNKSGNNSNA